MPHFHLLTLRPLSGSNSVVECNLAKVDVASSNLVSRSIFIFGPLAQPVEQVTLNHKVGGSKPSRPTIPKEFEGRAM
jgi:hypothetical protein